MVSIHKVLRKALRKARHKNQKFIIQNKKMKQITIKKTPGNLTISEFEECDEVTQSTQDSSCYSWGGVSQEIDIIIWSWEKTKNLNLCNSCFNILVKWIM